jgi:ABC-type lipopolysaccharide export system ATPase subunit
MITPTAEPASLIDVRNLVKRYDDRLVRNGFSLTVQRGETCVIIAFVFQQSGLLSISVFDKVASLGVGG